MMTGLLSVMVPEAGTNLINNPSAELASTGYSAGLSTLSRVTNYARFGITALKVVTGNISTAEGIVYNYDDTLLPSTAGQIYTFSVYVRGAGTVQLAIGWLNSSHAEIASVAGDTLTLENTGWTRYSLTALAPASTVYASVGVLTTSQQAVTFYCDGWQFENKDEATTYIDGDQPGGTWSGLYHGSASSRDANYRQGGDEVFLEDEGITLDMALAGIGLPPVVNNTSDYALLPGAQWQSTQIKSRLIDLVATAAGTSLAELLQKRQSLIDFFGPARGGQAARIGYWGANAERPIYCDVRYVQGLQFSNAQGFIEKPAIRLLAVDPYWYADDQEQAPLTLQQSVSNANYILTRKNGAWSALGTGGNGIVYSLALGKDGALYAGGNFAAMGGVTNTAYIAKWNGSAWSALGTGANLSDLFALAIGPDGSLYAGGAFTSMGGVTNTNHIAKWNGSAWVSIAGSGGANDIVQCLAVGPDGTLYAGGVFTSMAGVSNTAHIAKYDGSTWTALGTGANGNVTSLAIGIDGSLYAAGAFTAMSGVSNTAHIARWNGSAWSALGTGCDDGINALAIGRDGSLYATGAFLNAGGNAANRIAKWNGSAWSALGSGLNQTGYCLAVDDDGTLICGGFFTSAGGISTADRVALWNGSSWGHLDVDLPGTATVSACLMKQGLIVLGYNTSGTATAGAQTTVTPTGTADVYPVITLVGPSSGTLLLQWLENQTTKQRMYFNLTVNAGEMITIDLRTGRKAITSNWRGLVSDQPLRNSDFANWRLQPGANTIAAFVTGTTTGAALVANWQPAYLSVDGNA